MSKTITERFEEKFVRIPWCGCWIWTASVINGYGQFGAGGRAHRFSYSAYIGSIPHGKCVLHKCDTPLCVRPDHLFLGTRRDNNIDRDIKKRGRYGISIGEKNGFSKLTNDQAIIIKTDNRSIKMIASEYGVHIATIYRIKSGLRYAA